MVVVDLDEVLELARRTVEMKREAEVFGGLFPFFSFHRSSRLSELVPENPHDLVIRTLRTDKEEIVRCACSTLQLTAFNRTGTVIRLAVIRLHLSAPIDLLLSFRCNSQY